VIEGANLELVASLLVALNSLVLLRMIQSFHHGVALLAFQPTGALVPADVLL